MFAERARFSLTANRLAALLERKRRGGARILDLTASNPTQAGIEYPADLLHALADPAGLVYEPQAAGLKEARAAVADDFRRRAYTVDPERIVLTSSTSEAYAFLFKLLCDPGDAILVPCPSYPLFEYLARLEAVSVLRYDLGYDGRWHLSVEALERAITPRTRAVVLVNPNNPTGSFLKRDEHKALDRLCADRGLAIVSDEVFADYALADDAHRAGSVAADGDALAFALGGLSKSCGLPQLKLGWIAVSGPGALCVEALARLELIADTFLSVGTPVQRAAPSLLARRDELQGPIRRRVRRNAEHAASACLGTPATVLRIEGGWYATLHVPDTTSEEDRVLRLLEERDVLVHPGFFFDFPREAFLVLSLLTPESAFDAGLSAILEDVERRG